MEERHRRRGKAARRRGRSEGGTNEFKGLALREGKARPGAWGKPGQVPGDWPSNEQAIRCPGQEGEGSRARSGQDVAARETAAAEKKAAEVRSQPRRRRQQEKGGTEPESLDCAQFHWLRSVSN